MIRRDRPEFGWHAAHWGWLRRWLERRRTRADDLEETDEVGESAPEMPEVAPPAPRRWWHTTRLVALWCAAVILVVLALRPAPWLLGLLLGAAGAGLVLARATRRTDAQRLAHQLDRDQARRTARAVRAAHKARNRAAHAERTARRDEAARQRRKARRKANQAAHWRPPDAD